MLLKKIVIVPPSRNNKFLIFGKVSVTQLHDSFSATAVDLTTVGLLCSLTDLHWICHTIFGMRDERCARKSGYECLDDFVCNPSMPRSNICEASGFKRFLDGSYGFFVRILHILVSPCVLSAVHTGHSCGRAQTCSSL